MNEIERLQDRIRELRRALETQTARADKAEQRTADRYRVVGA